MCALVPRHLTMSLMCLSLLLLFAAVTCRIVPDSDGNLMLHQCRVACNALTDLSDAGCSGNLHCQHCRSSCVIFMNPAGRHFDLDCSSSLACDVGCQLACDFWSTRLREISAVEPPEPAEGPDGNEPQTLVIPLQSNSLDGESAVKYSTGDQFGSEGSRAQPAEIHTQESASPPPPTQLSNAQNVGWPLHLSSVSSDDSLVSVTVTWPALRPDVQYMVTWELQSGGLRGHMLLRDTAATLTLWPLELYTVQVFCGDDASERLLVDTRRPSSESSSVRLAVRLLVVVGAVLLAVLATLSITFLLVRKCCMTQQQPVHQSAVTSTQIDQSPSRARCHMTRVLIWPGNVCKPLVDSENQ